MGTLGIDCDGRRIKLGDDTLRGSTVHYTRCDTPPIVSNESLCKASSEKEMRNKLRSFTDVVFSIPVIPGGLADVDLHFILHDLKGGP